MALIKCPECGKEISDRAKVCINCGFPLDCLDEKEKQNETTLLDVPYDENDNIYIEFEPNNFIKIENGYMTVCTPLLGETKDLIDNFTLDYFAITWGYSVGFSMYNTNKEWFCGVRDAIDKNGLLDKLVRLKDIMDKHCCFANRSRFDAIYKLPKEIVAIRENQSIRLRNKLKGNGWKTCPNCGSDNFHAFIEEKEIIKGKTKTSYSANLNPLKPFTFANKKEKVVREPITIKKSKFLCDRCGHVFE